MRVLGTIVLWLLSLGALAAAALLGIGTWIARSQPVLTLAAVGVSALAALVFAAVVNPLVSKGLPGMGRAGPRWIAAVLMLLVGGGALAFSLIQTARLAQENISASVGDNREFGGAYVMLKGRQHSYGNEEGVVADIRIEADGYSGGPLARPMTEAEMNALILEPEKPRSVSLLINYAGLDLSPFRAGFGFDIIGVVSPPAGLAGWDYVHDLLKGASLVVETDAGERRRLPVCGGFYAGKAFRYSDETRSMEAIPDGVAVEQRLGVAPAYLTVDVGGCDAQGQPVYPPPMDQGDTAAYDAYSVRHEALLKDFIAFADGHVVTASLYDRSGRFLVKANFDARELSQAEAWGRQEASKYATPRP